MNNNIAKELWYERPNFIKEYKIISLLGSGTYGKVYKVKKKGHIFALKVIPLINQSPKLI